MICSTAESPIYGQLARAGTARIQVSGSETVADATLITTMDQNRSAPLRNNAFHVAWRSAAPRTILTTAGVIEIGILIDRPSVESLLLKSQMRGSRSRISVRCQIYAKDFITPESAGETRFEVNFTPWLLLTRCNAIPFCDMRLAEEARGGKSI